MALYCEKCGEVLIDDSCIRCGSVMDVERKKIRKAVETYGVPTGGSGASVVRIKGMAIEEMVVELRKEGG